jgi:hypothetical protein
MHTGTITYKSHQSMTLPNFLIIGAPKAGTTSLYYYLRQHPQIFMSSIKEPNFFATDGLERQLKDPFDRVWIDQSITELEKYCSLFSNVNDEKAIGEASTSYLGSRHAAHRIHYHVPDVRLVAVLRQPVERAYSHFCHLGRDGHEQAPDFRSGIRGEEERIRNHVLWGRYIHSGFYYEQLRPYFELFDRDQIRILLYDELRGSRSEMLQDIFQFLEVDEDFEPNTSVQHNVSGRPRSVLLHNLLVKGNPIKNTLQPLMPYWMQRVAVGVKNLNLSRPAPLDPELAMELQATYREDLLKLQDLLDRDLSGWLQRY